MASNTWQVVIDDVKVQLQQAPSRPTYQIPKERQEDGSFRFLQGKGKWLPIPFDSLEWDGSKNIVFQSITESERISESWTLYDACSEGGWISYEDCTYRTPVRLEVYP